MYSKLISASAALLLSANLVAAQTSSSCNPVKGDTCPDDAAFGGTVEIDFTQGASEYFTIADGTTLSYDSNGAAFSIAKDTDAPTITSTKYIFFGTVEVVAQAAPGTGIVTSIVLQSDDLDEIDWEWLGGDTTQVQTNYFSKGDTTTYDRGGYSSVSDPQSGFHTYTIDWSTDAVVWSIDGTTVRTLTYSSASSGATFPQTPMQLKLGTWDGGAADAATGTVEWAGGYTPFGDGDGPYVAYYKSVKIVDKSNGVSGATSYTYSGTSGTYDSIVVNTDNSTSSSSTTSSSTGTATSTKSSGSKTTGTATGTATDSASATKSDSSESTTLTTANATTASNGTVSTSSPTSTRTSSSSTASSTTVSTNGVAKSSASLFGAAAALLAMFALL